jgi:hypothetical protein
MGLTLRCCRSFWPKKSIAAMEAAEALAGSWLIAGRARASSTGGQSAASKVGTHTSGSRTSQVRQCSLGAEHYHQRRRPNHAQLRSRIAGPACPHPVNMAARKPMYVLSSTAQPPCDAQLAQSQPATVPGLLMLQPSLPLELEALALKLPTHIRISLTLPSQLQPASPLRHHPAARLHPQG